RSPTTSPSPRTGPWSRSFTSPPSPPRPTPSTPTAAVATVRCGTANNSLVGGVSHEVGSSGGRTDHPRRGGLVGLPPVGGDVLLPPPIGGRPVRVQGSARS